MLDKEKVKIMTDLAFYEQNQGKEDLKINEYYRNDYAGLHTICSIIWVTLGYAAVVGVVLFAALDFILVNISKTFIIMLAMGIIAGYIAVLIVYILLAHLLFSRKHRAARDRIRDYNYNLTKLLKLYEKEKR